MFPDGFQTSRLILRPIAMGDAEAIFDAYAQDAEVARFVSWKPHERLESVNAYIASAVAAAASRTYVLIGRQDGNLMGAFDLRNNRAHGMGFGYVLARAFWGMGLMTEALTEVCDWALAQTDVWRIGDCCDVENLASARVMRKSGLSCEGVARRWMLHPNVSAEPRDCFIYAKVK